MAALEASRHAARSSLHELVSTCVVPSSPRVAELFALEAQALREEEEEQQRLEKELYADMSRHVEEAARLQEQYETLVEQQLQQQQNESQAQLKTLLGSNIRPASQTAHSSVSGYASSSSMVAANAAASIVAPWTAAVPASSGEPQQEDYDQSQPQQQQQQQQQEQDRVRWEDVWTSPQDRAASPRQALNPAEAAATFTSLIVDSLSA